MQKIHNGIHDFATRFLPDLKHLPTNGFAKNAIFFLGMFGFMSMFLATVSANVDIDTSLSNSVMTIQKLRITNNGLPNGTPVIEQDNQGVKLLYLGAPSGVLKRNATTNYIIQGSVSGVDIGNYEIDGTKIQNNAVTSTKIASNTITNTKIATGTITCDRLNLSSFPGLSCSSATPLNGSCTAGEFVQGISSGGVLICTGANGGSGSSLPSCSAGQTIVYSGGSWMCTTTTYGSTGSSFWDSNGFNIYNLNAGNVGIGITSPSQKLTVSGSVLVKGTGTPYTATGGGLTGNVSVASGLATADANAILYINNGKVGILTSNPQYTLDVVGTIRAAGVITTSDKRLKTNITPLSDALKNILGIHGYMYNLKLDGSTQYGVLAQEVEQFFPYIVSTDSNGYKAVNYNGLIAPIIESIHELDAKVQSVQATYKSNEDRIAALEKKLLK